MLELRLAAALAAQPVPVFAPIAPLASIAPAEVLEEAAVAATEPPGGANLYESDSPRWPDEGEESSFIAGQRAAGLPIAPASAKLAEENIIDRQPLPALEDLISRIPAKVRETLDELFRAKFNAVKRVPSTSLKSQD